MTTTNGSDHTNGPRPRGRDARRGKGRRTTPRTRALLALLALGAAGATTAGLALAQGGGASLSLRTASSGTLHTTIVLSPHGRTLYVLSPESSTHLLCRSRACLALWPPLTVRSRSVRLAAAHGVRGHLGLLHRSDGTLQVTLRGLPLYRYSGDSGSAETNGEGIRSFGGTWHAVRAGASSSITGSAPTTTAPATTTPTTMTTTTPTTSTPSPYGY